MCFEVRRVSVGRVGAGFPSERLRWSLPPGQGGEVRFTIKANIANSGSHHFTDCSSFLREDGLSASLNYLAKGGK